MAIKIGISFAIPLPQITTITAVNKEITASDQSFLAISTAVGARDRPIIIITGPTTTGGKRRSINRMPRALTIADTIPYTSPTAIIPDKVPGQPNNLVASIIGAI